ncbi:hypothetical protein DFS34DRAFT_113307 [Phlyctochytrium arcticum]|nr:hypothetical protein DFS34DRAFT_113307 [Phlyctochytrium arcticum]
MRLVSYLLGKVLIGQLPSRDEGATPTPATSNRLSHRQRSSSQSSASSPNLRSQSLQPQKQPHSHHHHSRHHHQIPQHSSQTQAKGQPQVKHPTVAHQQSTLSSPNPGIAAVDSPLISDNDGRVGVGSSSIDAPTLYKQIREGLSPGQFEEFASNVALFNSGQQTADQTVRNVGQIVKERRLFVQMRTLIYTALEESGDGAGTAPATSTGTPVSNAQSPNNAFAVAEEDGAKLDTPS